MLPPDKARPYQQNIIDVCIKRNSIVFLPTGSGKSFIATMVIKHFSHQLEKKYSEGGKRSIFLVNTIVLAKQIEESISNQLPYKVCILTGEQNVDAFNEGKWREIIDENEILVLTAQCFADAVTHTYISLAQINVLVFDECHHARKDHVYHQIMRSFGHLNKSDQKNIRIIGLTGMLVGIDGSIKPETVSKEMNKLESTFESTIITVNNFDDHKNVLIYSTKPEDLFVLFPSSSQHECIQNLNLELHRFISKLEKLQLDKQRKLNPKTLRIAGPKKISDLIKLLKDYEYQTKNMGSYGSYLALLSVLIQLELTKRFSDSQTFRDVVKVCITQVELWKKILKEEIRFDENDSKSIYDHSSKKIQILILLLKKFFSGANQDFQCLIFTQRRSTAKVLYHLIKSYAKSVDNLKITPDFVVGTNNEMPESIEAIVSQSNNSLAIEKFKNKETNCIISTNVLEEGIDLQMCNLVIMYDHPDTYRSYVQSRGRARDQKSKYIVMLEEDFKLKFEKNKRNWTNVEQTVKNELVGKTLDRESPDAESIENERQEAWEPFATKAGSKLTSINSIAILNQYSMAVASDRYSCNNMIWERIDLPDNKVKVKLLLPVQSMITEKIEGDPQENVRMAKRSVAFKACIKLYETGNITENLTPFDNSVKIEESHQDYFSHWEKYKDDKKGSAGTRNNYRYHNIKVPKAIQNCGPILNDTNFLYRINVKPKFETANNETLQTFLDLYSSNNTFAILTNTRMPKLCSIPLFQSYGEIECSIETPPSVLVLKEENDLKFLRKFHFMIFRDILTVSKDFFVIDKNSYLIVPLNEHNEIDWNLVKTFSELSKPTSLTHQMIQQMEFNPIDYLHKVINPVYRKTEQNYVVTRVLTDKSPLTPFPTNRENFPTYKEYYCSKYPDVSIYKNDQFLIEVKGISKNINLFFPGSGKSGKKSKYENFNLQEEYIPELCHNYKFPADYWLKAILLPVICHRMFYMLLAEELRKWLIKEKIDLDNGEQIYKLDVEYGNYDKREEQLNQDNLETECNGKLNDFKSILGKHKLHEHKSKTSSIPTKALLMWDKSLMPMDIDRNWLTVTEADIEYYCSFVNENSAKTVPENLRRLRTVENLKLLCLKDTENRADISLLYLNNSNSSVQQKDLIKVLTTSKSGDVFDMERYEVLGDAFLKFIVSLFLYKKFEKYHEGCLSALKGKIVSNRNLFYLGNDFELSNMLKATKFCDGNQLQGLPPSTNLPLNLRPLIKNNKTLLIKLFDLKPLSADEIEDGMLKEKDMLKMFHKPTNESNQFDSRDFDNVDKGLLGYINEQWIGDKTVADSIEALIGCVISSIGINSGQNLCQKLKVLPQNENLQGLLSDLIPPRIIFHNTTQTRIMNRETLEKKLNYKFKNELYLLQALTHASYPIKITGTYEQLEFLGDAILDFLITSYISEQCPKMDPGKLTDLRSALVNNVTLACIVVRNDIHKFLLAENHSLSEAIKNFVRFQESRNHFVTDEVLLLKTEDDSVDIAEAVDVPKALGDIFESIVGAVFLDSNLSFETTWKVIYNLMQNEIAEWKVNVPLQIVRRLFEYQKGIAKAKFYNTEKIEGDDNVAVPLKIMCHGEEKNIIGFGKNRELAKKAAAKKALLELAKQP